jgi:hypothetical protein
VSASAAFRLSGSARQRAYTPGTDRHIRVPPAVDRTQIRSRNRSRTQSTAALARSSELLASASGGASEQPPFPRDRGRKRRNHRQPPVELLAGEDKHILCDAHAACPLQRDESSHSTVRCTRPRQTPPWHSTRSTRQRGIGIVSCFSLYGWMNEPGQDPALRTERGLVQALVRVVILSKYHFPPNPILTTRTIGAFSPIAGLL